MDNSNNSSVLSVCHYAYVRDYVVRSGHGGTKYVVCRESKLSFHNKLCISCIQCHCILDAQDVTVELTEPDPTSQQFPCPNQRVVYECRTLVGSTALTWTLPTDMTRLAFEGSEITGTTRTSSYGQFTAVLDRSDPDNTNSSLYWMTSTLIILPPLAHLAGSTVTCAGGTTTGDVVEIITIVMSGE